MYKLATPLHEVKGIGPIVADKLAAYDLHTVLDFLLWLPIRYEDRSKMVEIKDLEPGELVTIQATVIDSRNYYKGRRSIQSATVADNTGKLKLMWFNNRFIMDTLTPQASFLISGKLGDKGSMIQPIVEKISSDTTHTARLIPIYAKLGTIKQGSLRRLLKHILDQLEPPMDAFEKLFELPISLSELFSVLHFPDNEAKVVLARERLALEELITLMRYSLEVKSEWKQQKKGIVIKIRATTSNPVIPATVPFKLTYSQQQAVKEILDDLAAPQPMNRLLLGDVGTGKTVVAGIAIYHVLENHQSAALIAPTQILAEQHAQTLKTLFPNFKLELITSATKKSFKKTTDPTIYVGTHAVIPRLEIINPALIIYDEQHRFGASQRTFSHPDVTESQPHILTMSATPIPRSLMLTLFSHLTVSQLTELPPSRLPVKSWLVPSNKRESSWEWIATQIIKTKMQVFVVCPFIDPSETSEFEHVSAASSVFEELSEYFQLHHPELRLELLHGKMAKRQKIAITEKLYSGEIDILVTTPVIEVGLDVPNAGIIVIQSCERFGLASLHQLRGRVGRGEQQSYCLLFASKPGKHPRLRQFASETNGLKLAELDLERRGAGDLFGTQQSGFDHLRFANWTNLSLITQARQLYDRIETEKIAWQPFIPLKIKTPANVAAN